MLTLTVLTKTDKKRDRVVREGQKGRERERNRKATKIRTTITKKDGGLQIISVVIVN